MEKIIIRKADHSHLKTIQDLNAELFRHDSTYDELLVLDWPYKRVGRQYFKELIDGKAGVCFVAEIDGNIVGYLAGAIKGSESWRAVKKRAELENMLVKKEYRGRGVGSKLVQQFLKWSKKQKAEKVLVVAYTTNQKAIKFYKKNKFVPYNFSLEAELST